MMRLLFVWVLILPGFRARRQPADAFLDSELKLTQGSLEKSPKSYSAWQHRQWFASFGCVDLAGELALCNKFLLLDSRNFHCWNYRRFVVEKSGTAPEKELAYTGAKIEENFSNFSAWHYRSRLLPRVLTEPAALLEKVEEGAHAVLCLDNNSLYVYFFLMTSLCSADFKLIQSAFYTEPDDQSAWLYHRWLLLTTKTRTAVFLFPYILNGLPYVFCFAFLFTSRCRHGQICRNFATRAWRVR
jgi:geranylgeranyl transferase type-2 subunit alpha